MNADTQRVAMEHIAASRRVLGLKESRKSDYWMGMDEARKAGYLRHARRYDPSIRQSLTTAWEDYTSKERFAIEQAIRTLVERTFDDAFMLGIIRGVRRPEAG